MRRDDELPLQARRNVERAWSAFLAWVGHRPEGSSPRATCSVQAPGGRERAQGSSRPPGGCRGRLLMTPARYSEHLELRRLGEVAGVGHAAGEDAVTSEP